MVIRLCDVGEDVREQFQQVCGRVSFEREHWTMDIDDEDEIENTVSRCHVLRVHPYRVASSHPALSEITKYYFLHQWQRSGLRIRLFNTRNT